VPLSHGRLRRQCSSTRPREPVPLQARAEVLFRRTSARPAPYPAAPAGKNKSRRRPGSRDSSIQSPRPLRTPAAPCASAFQRQPLHPRQKPPRAGLVGPGKRQVPVEPGAGQRSPGRSRTIPASLAAPGTACFPPLPRCAFTAPDSSPHGGGGCPGADEPPYAPGLRAPPPPRDSNPTAEPAAPAGRDSLFGSLAPVSRIHTPKTTSPADPDPGRRLFAPPGGPLKIPGPPLRATRLHSHTGFRPEDLLGFALCGHSAAGVFRKSKTRPCRPAGDRHGLSALLAPALVPCDTPYSARSRWPVWPNRRHPGPHPRGLPSVAGNRASWTRSRDSDLGCRRVEQALASHSFGVPGRRRHRHHECLLSIPGRAPRILPRRPRGGLLRSSFGPQKVKTVKIQNNDKSTPPPPSGRSGCSQQISNFVCAVHDYLHGDNPSRLKNLRSAGNPEGPGPRRRFLGAVRPKTISKIHSKIRINNLGE